MKIINNIAVINSQEILIKDVSSALDLIANVSYETKCYRMAINKSAVAEEFFDLKTKLAGDILQKFINYDTKLAIYGDYSMYTSKALRDFIYESNNGNDIYFVADEESAIEKLKAAV